VVFGMTRREQSFDGCAFGPEDLAILDQLLAPVRLAFEDTGCKGRIVGNQVCHTASMISVPMG